MPSTRHTRREILGLGGSTLALLAGCLGAPVPSSDDESATTESPTQTNLTKTAPPTTESVDVTVPNVEITPEIVGLDSPDSIGTVGERDEQFVLVTILLGGESRPAVEEFSLSTDEREFSPIPPDDLPAYGHLWGRGPAYGSRAFEDKAGLSGYLVFQVPKPLDSSEVAFDGPGGQFTFDSTARERLARPPTEFAVSEVTAPETVESMTEMSISASIENVGSHDGTFVGALNRVGPHVAYTPVKRVSVELSAGASTTWTYSYRPKLTGGNGPMSMRFKLNWRDGRTSTETMVEPTE
ncbi:hypothetical protein [Haloferax sp. YSSS75]|uniref:hypothetical protein n=1 Tax=Haloferax sp. YSSS75 TaxID=3388564 RepID=UPI00398D2513